MSTNNLLVNVDYNPHSVIKQRFLCSLLSYCLFCNVYMLNVLAPNKRLHGILEDEIFHQEMHLGNNVKRIQASFKKCLYTVRFCNYIFLVVVVCVV